MNERVYLAASDSLILIDHSDGDWREAGRSLQGQRLTSVMAWGDTVIAGSVDGLWLSRDQGQTWKSASDCIPDGSRHIRWLARNASRPVRIFAGTEPAEIFTSEDGGETWQGHPEVPELRDRFGWYLPYSPEAGCVRGFAFSGSRGYAAVEQGGVLVTDDNGDTW